MCTSLNLMYTEEDSAKCLLLLMFTEEDSAKCLLLMFTEEDSAKYLLLLMFTEEDSAGLSKFQAKAALRNSLPQRSKDGRYRRVCPKPNCNDSIIRLPQHLEQIKRHKDLTKEEKDRYLRAPTKIFVPRQVIVLTRPKKLLLTVQKPLSLPHQPPLLTQHPSPQPVLL